eukprot:gnl/MRDRNA2_/MRDRNA2_75171_c0_seq1.p1 gnl/MRDRNA2_/MRDRNA2_75171_c0~~gnl/MRDRNA2_/MRDRNA2_75171_c0_seq1.p1  ORF type:complete len:160 (+),score=30.84 gnl/MRDRNA2_/MRDRNA2_75171_c0_seq1:86-565(+)
MHYTFLIFLSCVHQVAGKRFAGTRMNQVSDLGGTKLEVHASVVGSKANETSNVSFAGKEDADEPGDCKYCWWTNGECKKTSDTRFKFKFEDQPKITEFCKSKCCSAQRMQAKLSCNYCWRINGECVMTLEAQMKFKSEEQSTVTEFCKSQCCSAKASRR